MIDKDKIKEQNIQIIDTTESTNPFFEHLKKNFPQVIDSDNQVSLKTITTLLGINQNANMQGYELTFAGKGLANAMYSTSISKELRLEVKQSKFTPPPPQNLSAKENITETKNTIIRGDNLDVLKLLKSAYSDKIKMIYIDPPYNTKNENFIYPDNFREDYKKILIETGLLTFNEEGEEIPSETLKFFRNITGTRSHSGYLSFMLPRVKLARDLLSEDGVIFISIDDNEQANLKLLCDEIFGEENFVGDFIWKSKSGGANDSKFIAIDTEYILCYGKDIDKTYINLDIEAVVSTNYNYKDDNGEYALDRLDKQSIRYSDTMDYEIKDNEGNSYFPKHKDAKNPNATWRWGKETIVERFDELVFKDGYVYTKNYKKDSTIVRNLLVDKRFGRTRTGKKNFYDLFKLNIFTSPKPTNLIRHFIQISTNPNDIILDFFAGSGTTAQAVMELNAEDGGNREFILVQIDQEIDKDKNKTAHDFCKNELGSQTPVISDITIERVNRAGENIKKTFKEDLTKSNQNLDIGYKVYTLTDKPSMIINEEGSLKLISSRDELSSYDIARNLALSSGKILSLPLEEIIKDKLYFCEDSYYLLSIDDEVRNKLEIIKDFQIYVDGYSDIDLENLLNLNVANKEQIKVVY